MNNMVGNLVFLGTVQAPAPIYHRLAVKNFVEFQTWSYEYYRTFPYRRNSGTSTSKRVLAMC